MLIVLTVRNTGKQKKTQEKLFFGILKATAKKNRIRIRNPVYRSKDRDPEVSRIRNTEVLICKFKQHFVKGLLFMLHRV
jgi:hypothetical protein